MFINGVENQTNHSIINGAYNYFAVNLTEGNYTWIVNCTDNSSQSAFGESYFKINISYGSSSCTQSSLSCGSWSNCVNGHHSRSCTIYNYNDICNNTYTYTETLSCSGGGGGGGGFVPINKTREETKPEEKTTVLSVLGEAVKQTGGWMFQPASKPKQELPQKCIACWIIPCGDYWLVVILLSLIIMISYLLVKRNDIIGYVEERKEKKNGLEIKAHNKDLNEDFLQWEIISLSLFLFAMPLITYWLSTICWALIVLLVELIYIIYEFFRKDDYSKEIKESMGKSKEFISSNNLDEANISYKKAVDYYHKSNEEVKNKLRVELDLLGTEIFGLVGKEIKKK